MNSSKKKRIQNITVITDEFIDFKENSFSISTRGSNILLFSIISEAKEYGNFNFKIIQMGREDRSFFFQDIPVYVINSKSIYEFNCKLRQRNIVDEVIHYNNIDLFEAKIPNTYTTATIHTNAFLEGEIAKKWLRENINFFDKIVVVNEEYKKEFKETFLIRNGISSKTFIFQQDKRLDLSEPIIILFPNLNSPKKNRDFAIELIEKLNFTSKYKFKLLLAGSHEELLLGSEAYEFVGKQEHGVSMNHLYRRSYITIIPSISESCSLCALESMSSGTVVLANDIYGIRSYIENKKNGYLIDIKEIDKWIESINRLVEDKEIYSSIQQNARKQVEKEYNSEIMAQQYCSMWTNLINKEI